MSAVPKRLEELARRYDLSAGAAPRLDRLLGLLADDPHAPTTVRDPAAAVDVHVADSLAGLEVDAVRAAQGLADLGSGAGFPGIPLAVALPAARVALVESVARKAEFLRRAVEAAHARNAEVVVARAEAWPDGLGRHDVVTARALAALPVLVEYAAPLLRVGGALVAWKGRPAGDERRDGDAAAAALGMEPAEVHEVSPFPGARDRTLFVYVKVAETPAGYPRRPGIAAKRPLRAA